MARYALIAYLISVILQSSAAQEALIGITLICLVFLVTSLPTSLGDAGVGRVTQCHWLSLAGILFLLIASIVALLNNMLLVSYFLISLVVLLIFFCRKRVGTIGE
jgi:hypothetical protein